MSINIYTNDVYSYYFLQTGERIRIKNASKNEGTQEGMELFLDILEKKVEHPDRWYRFVQALKEAGMSRIKRSLEWMPT